MTINFKIDEEGQRWLMDKYCPSCTRQSIHLYKDFVKVWGGEYRDYYECDKCKSWNTDIRIIAYDSQQRSDLEVKTDDK